MHWNDTVSLLSCHLHKPIHTIVLIILNEVKELCHYGGGTQVMESNRQRKSALTVSTVLCK